MSSNQKIRVSVARPRLAALFDEGRFDEFGADVTHSCTDFGMDKRHPPGDGVVTAVGRVEGRTVVAYSQDRSVLGGSLGLAHARKISRAQDMALEMGAPFVGINDGGGPGFRRVWTRWLATERSSIGTWSHRAEFHRSR